MFRLIRFAFSATLLLLAAGVVIYFLPTEIKLKGLAAISGIVPESVKEKAEKIVFTPSERRDQIITDLEQNIEDLKNNPSEETAQEIAASSETLLEKLRGANDDPSLTEALTGKVIDAFVKNEQNAACEKN